VCYVVLTLVQVAGIAHFPGWLPNRFYFLHPLDFVVAIGSALRPYGLLKPFGRSNCQVFWPSLIGEPSGQYFTANPFGFSYTVGATSSRVMRSSLPATTRMCLLHREQ